MSNSDDNNANSQEEEEEEEEEERVFQGLYEKEINQFNDRAQLAEEPAAVKIVEEEKEMGKIFGHENISAISMTLASVVASSILSISTNSIDISTSTTLSIDQATATGSSQPGATVRLNETTSLSVASTIIIELLKLVFGHVPYFIFRILSTTLSLTVTLDFWTGMYLFSGLTLLSVIVYRYRFLNSYSRLPIEPQLPKNTFDLKPDITLDDTSRNNAYPDEFMNAFLSSIKVFGYLDRPVFYELAKNLQTKRMKPGEVLFGGDFKEENLDFYVVVEGKMQVFIKTNDSAAGDDEESDDSDQPESSSESKKYSSKWTGHHLLNEVRSGGTVSSLFSILSILSEDLKLPSPLISTQKKEANESSESGTVSDGSLYKEAAEGVEIPRAMSADESSARDTTPEPHSKGENVPFVIETAEFKTDLEKLENRTRSVHPNLVARAATNTTLAVIPAASFRNLAEKFPKAASHMVSVILTRFQRVTFLTLQRYLGLSQELLEIEKRVNEIAGSGLPTELFPPALVESCAWRLSHQYSESSTSAAKSGVPYQADTAPLMSSRTPTVKARPFALDYLTMSPDDDVRFDIDDDVRCDIDDRLCDAVFTSIAQLIGLTPSKETVTPDLLSPPKRPSTTMQSHMGMSIERFYYSSRNNTASSIAPSVASKRNSLYNEEDAMSTTSSMADSTAEEFSGQHSQNNEVDIPDVQLQFFKQGNTILKEGVRCSGLFFVLDGILEATTSSGNGGDAKSTKNAGSNSGRRKKLFVVKPGGLAGYLGALTGNASFVTMTAKTDVLVGLMRKSVLDRYVEKYPNVLLCLAKRLVQQLSPLVLHIDVALEWGQVNAGEPSHSIFIVLTGRLRSIKENDSSKDSSNPSIEIQGEYGQSESVGELEVLLDSPRTSTIHAIRDSEIAIMPKTLFNALALRHPEIMLTISRMIARSSRSTSKKVVSGGNNLNLRTVALLPVSSNTPILEFAHKLFEALRDMNGNPALIQTRSIMSHLGRHAFTRLGRLKLMSWLHEQEEIHRIVLYVADGGVTAPWTQRCIRQADCVLLVGLQEGDPSVGEYEQLLLSMKTTARKELVLLNPKRNCPNGSTAAWLKPRLWVHAHHHIQMALPSTGLSFDKMQLKTKQTTFLNLGAHFQKIYNSQVGFRFPSSEGSSPKVFTGIRSDFSRLARRLLSKSIGLVLGGGGARGISHVGILRALEEAGIPIDIIGGTSIGAFVGGLYARENDQVSVYGRCKSFSADMASTWRTVLDLTYPYTSMVSGGEFNRAIWKAFSDTQIEDCWLPYYAITTNITFSREEVHTQGYIWRYVRASMSLAGWLPPICENGSMLMDGGYLNNLPANVAQNLGAQVVIAVDVGGSYSTLPVTYGDQLSGWWVMFNAFNPFAKNYGLIPKLGEIQGRLAYASSVLKQEEVLKSDGIHYLVPPILKYGTLEFSAFAEIEQIGYEFMKEKIKHWNEDGTLLEQFGVRLESNAGSKIHVRRASI